MTVSSTNSRLEYVGSGTTGPFNTPHFIDTGDIVVLKVEIATGDSTTLALTTDYTLSGIGNEAGGTLTLTSALTSSYMLIIYRDPALLQDTDYPEHGPFPAESHERALDKLVHMVQRAKDIATRSLRFPDSTSSAASSVLPSPVADKFLRWNSGATALINGDLTDVATTITGQNWKRDVFSGDGATVNFTLSADPAIENNTQVYVETAGVWNYISKSDYSVSGTTLTFSVAPASGTNNIEVMHGTAVINTVTTIDSNAVNTAAIQDNAVTSVKIADGSITLAKIADGIITVAKLVTNFFSGLSTASPAANDYIPLMDVSDSNTSKRVLLSDVLALTSVGGAASGETTYNTSQTLSVSTDNWFVVRCTSGTPVYTFPTAVGNEGKGFWVYNMTANDTAVRLVPNGAESIGGATGSTIYVPAYTAIGFVSDNVNWIAFSYSGKRIWKFGYTGATQYWYCPPGVFDSKLDGCAGGGGGAGAPVAGGSAGGGGGEACAGYNAPVTPGTQYTVTVGDGGAGAYYNGAASAGGVTSFGAILSLSGGGGASGGSNGTAGGTDSSVAKIKGFDGDTPIDGVSAGKGGASHYSGKSLTLGLGNSTVPYFVPGFGYGGAANASTSPPSYGQQGGQGFLTVRI